MRVTLLAVKKSQARDCLKIAPYAFVSGCRVAVNPYAEGRTRTGTGVTAQRILSPLCLPFHHPGRDGKSTACTLSYSYLFHQILWHFSYQLVIHWSLSRGKYTLPAERSEERSCYHVRPLAVGFIPFEL